MKILNSIVLVLIFFTISSCGSSPSQKSDSKGISSNSRDEIRLKQYRVKGRQIYAQICANCHQNDGSGLAGLFPPLAESDYLLNDLKRAACLIKNGLAEEIIVNGKRYSQMMPANTKLTPLEIAEVLTFITNSWGNEKGLSGVKEVEIWLNDCQK